MSLDNLILGDSAKKNMDKLNNTIESVNALIAGGGTGGGSGVRRNLIDNPEFSIRTYDTTDSKYIADRWYYNYTLSSESTAPVYDADTKTMTVSSTADTVRIIQQISDIERFSGSQVSLQVSLAATSGDFAAQISVTNGTTGQSTNYAVISGSATTLSGSNNCTLPELSASDSMVVAIVSHSTISLDHIKLEYGLIPTEYEPTEDGDETLRMQYKEMDGSFKAPYYGENLLVNSDFALHSHENTVLSLAGWSSGHQLGYQHTNSNLDFILIQNDTISQVIHGRDLYGKICTVTIYGEESKLMYTGTARVASSVGSDVVFIDNSGVTVTISTCYDTSTGHESIKFSIYSSKSLMVSAVKLEVGKNSTPYIHPNAAVELLKTIPDSQCTIMNNKIMQKDDVSNPNLVRNPLFTINTTHPDTTTHTVTKSATMDYYDITDGWRLQTRNADVTYNVSSDHFIERVFTGTIEDSYDDDIVQYLMGDDVTRLLNQTVTFSALCESDTSTRSCVWIAYTTGVDWSNNSHTHIGTARKRRSVTINIPSNATQIAYGMGTFVADDDGNSHTDTINKSLIFGEPKLEIGSLTTQFELPLSIDDKLRCAQYLGLTSGVSLPFDSLGHNGRIRIMPNADLDTYNTESGAYFVSDSGTAATISNIPYTAGGGWLNVRCTGESTVQEYIVWKSQGLSYYRIYNGTTWNTWTQIIRSMDVASATTTGIVTTGEQTFAGVKRFNNNLYANSTVVVPNSVYYTARNTSGLTLNAIGITNGNLATLYTNGANTSSLAIGSSDSPHPYINTYTGKFHVVGGHYLMDNSMSLWGRIAAGTNSQLIGINASDVITIGGSGLSIAMGTRSTAYTTICGTTIYMGFNTAQHTIFRGHVYFANGTAYYISNTGTARLAVVVVTGATVTSIPQVRNLSSGTATATTSLCASGAWYGQHS